MNNVINLLAKSRMFSHVSKEKLSAIFYDLQGRVKCYHKGETVLCEDDIADYIGIVLQGSLFVTKLFLEGEYSLIHHLEPLNMVAADIACTNTKKSPYFIYAKEETSIFFIPFGIIGKQGKIDEEVRLCMMNNILKTIAHENIRKYYKIEILSRKSIRERILIYLTIQQKIKKSDTFSIPFNREQLAQYLCVNRSALSHELSLMQKEGILETKRNRITMLKQLY
jgi:Cyclic nucleotide-binding domain.